MASSAPREGSGLIPGPTYPPDVTLSRISRISTISCRGGTSSPATIGVNERDAALINLGADEHFEVGDDKEVLVGRSSVTERHLANHSSTTDDRLLDLQRVPSYGSTGTDHDCHPHLLITSDDTTARNKLIVVSVCCLLFMIAEIVGGFLSHSLALVTDAAHLGCDLAGFLVSLLAIWLAKRPPTQRLTFGFHRAEVIGALMSVMIIWVVAGVLVYMAVLRVQNPDYKIDATVMLVTAALGVCFNIIMGVVLHSGLVKQCQLRGSLGHGHSHGSHAHSHSHSHDQQHNHHHGNATHGSRGTNLRRFPPRGDGMEDSVDVIDSHDASKKNINVRAALVHVVGDLIQSIGVCVAAIVIKVNPEYKLADPVCTFLASALVLITTIFVIRDVVLIVMEAVPHDLDMSQVKQDLSLLLGVKSVHSCHAWALTVDKVALSAHVAIDSLEMNCKEVLRSATMLLREKHHVYHCTIQVEEYDRDIMEDCNHCSIPTSHADGIVYT